MRPVRLRLKGFTSFKDGADIPFEGLDRFAICGPTGAGKSSLLDALTFALFAEAPRRGTGNLANLISLGRKSFAVSLDFSVGGQSFRATRVRRRSSTGNDQFERLTDQDKTELVATGERAVTEKIEQLLGLNYGHFTQAVFLPQGKFSEFLKAKPAERRRLLNELLRLLVYERMQESAGRERDAHGGRKAQTERRLQEDFDGVSEEAGADLERQQQVHLSVVAEADAVLPGLQSCWEEAQRGRAWTVELDAKQADRTRHQTALPDVEAARRAVDAANRAAAVIPLLQQADTAGQEEQRRQQALKQSIQACEQCRAGHQAATAALKQATEAACALPSLRSRLNLLNFAKGKLGLRDQLHRQLDEQRDRHRTLAADRAAAGASAETLAHEIAGFEQEFTKALTDLDAIGFNNEHLQRLEAQQPAAMRLQSDRAQLRDLSDQAQQDAANAVNSAAAAEAAGRMAQQEQAAASTARQRREEAEQALRIAEAAHAASHLRTGLKPGQACPVCRQEVLHVPADEMVPELELLRQALATAKGHVVSAEVLASNAATAYAAARATADAASDRAEASRSDVARRQEQLTVREQALFEKLGDLLVRSSAIPVEEQALAAAQQAGDRHSLHLQAANRLSELRTKLALKKKDRATQVAQVGRLDEDLRVTTARIAADMQSLQAVREEIYEAAGTDEPGAESERVQGEIDRIEVEVASATQSERATSDRLRLAESLAENRAQEASQASARARDARAQAASALQKAGFIDDSAARAADLTTSQVRAIQDRITEYEAMSRALDHRIAELETALRGKPVSAQECEQARQAHEACAQRRKAAETQAAVCGQQVQDLQARLARAKQLREDLAEQERLHRIFDWLARDLRNDRFQAYLLEETLVALVTSASCQLTRLTGERYGLAFEDERIFVIDYDNAGERRGIETLSGGELFLASLSLALALSEQVQKAAGAVHLDCLFIDEGFGTLDPETLRTVSDAIRGLQVGGRMVGIITHVPELKEEFDQLVIVEKEGGSSRVQIEVG
jgi:exonuclease SbcC